MSLYSRTNEILLLGALLVLTAGGPIKTSMTHVNIPASPHDSSNRGDGDHGFLPQPWRGRPGVVMASRPRDAEAWFNICVLNLAIPGAVWTKEKQDTETVNALKRGFDMWWGAVPERFFPPDHVRRTSDTFNIVVEDYPLYAGISLGDDHTFQGGCNPSKVKGHDYYDLIVLITNKYENFGPNASITKTKDLLPGVFEPFWGMTSGANSDSLISLGFNYDGSPPEVDVRGDELPGDGVPKYLTFEEVVRHEIGHWMGLDDTYRDEPNGWIFGRCKFRPDLSEHPKSLMCGVPGLWTDDSDGALCLYCNVWPGAMRPPEHPCEAQLDSPACKDLALVPTNINSRGYHPWQGGFH